MNQEPINPSEPTPNLPTDSTESPAKKGINPTIAITVAIVIALTLAGISLIVFLRSDTRKQVDITEQVESSAADSNLSESPDDTSDLSENDLSSIESDITDTATDVNSGEFGSSELTDSSLGL
ncbi:MAG: hypothetical protein AAB624_03675 [Patescibacteria group bacterium]